MAKPAFIGIENLTHIADQYSSQIIMGASYFRPEEMERLGFNVISGLQFKNTKTVMARKGGTTRRKVVGETVANKIGYLEERVLTAKLTWNRYYDNRDNYVETPYPVEGSAEFSYPLSEAAFLAITANYGEDLYANLFFGDLDNEEVKGKEALSLYDGVHTYLRHDIEAGNISKALGNLVHCDALDAPTDSHDYAAWTAFEAWWAGLSPALKSAKEVLVYCSSETGVTLANAYANKWHGNHGVVYTGTGNFTVPEHQNVEFAPSDIFGRGDKLYASVPLNFEYGVNSLDSRSKIVVREGSDKDTEDIMFQVQSIQGVRVVNVHASQFAMSDGTVQEVTVMGDYTKDTFTVGVSDTAAGSVTVNGAEPDNTVEYPEGTTLTLAATANSGYVFKGWSNGKTDAEITVVTKGQPEAIMAVFKKE